MSQPPFPFPDWNEGVPLPNAAQAIIPIEKFRDYSMNPDHPSNYRNPVMQSGEFAGFHTGKWIAWHEIGYDVLTFEGRQQAAVHVIPQIEEQIEKASAGNLYRASYGWILDVYVRVSGPQGLDGKLYTGWQYDDGKEVPRLVTNWLIFRRSGSDET